MSQCRAVGLKRVFIFEGKRVFNVFILSLWRKTRLNDFA